MLLSLRLPITVPEHRRAEMAEAITRANYGLIIGSFEMDMNDGELSYKVAVPTDESTLSVEQYRHCMGAAFSTVQRYLPAFHQIVFDDVPASEAIDRCGG